jgi:cytochrome P450
MTEQAVYFSPWDPEFCANPYPHYSTLLSGAPPLLHFGSSQVALLARYDHCAAALRDHERFSNVEPAPLADAYKGPVYPERDLLGQDPPEHTRLRSLKGPVEVGATELAGGMVAFIVLAAANRDPAQIPNPERFDITRTPNAHLAFGEGIHFCIGAPLARLEAAIAIGEMFRRFPRLRMKDPAAVVQYKGSYFLRGLAALPMALE